MKGKRGRRGPGPSPSGPSGTTSPPSASSSRPKLSPKSSPSPSPSPPPPSEDEIREKEHFESVVRAFNSYLMKSNYRLILAQRRFEHLPPHMREAIPNFSDKLKEIHKAATANQRFLSEVVKPHSMFENDGTIQINEESTLPINHHEHKSESDQDKVRSTLRQCVRDWSEEGAIERKECYDPLLEELEKYFPSSELHERNPVHVLVPGAGLARLTFEIAKKGFHCQGNEFSYFMLLCSNYFLNRVESVGQFEIFPYIHQFSNVWSLQDQLKSVKIPDVIAEGLPPGSDFSMTAGDFLEVYGGEKEKWDCVITCFFIDTAKNIVAYIEVIEKILKHGGVWINLGPLLYHFEELHDEISIELTYEEVKHVIVKYGLEIKREEVRQATYVNNIRSMHTGVYNCAFFTAIKPSSR